MWYCPNIQVYLICEVSYDEKINICVDNDLYYIYWGRMYRYDCIGKTNNNEYAQLWCTGE